MGRKRKFEVKTITHPSGEVSYEAYGRVGSAKEPTRKRFDTWEEANAFALALEARHNNAMGSRRSVFTTLDESQVTDAETALKELQTTLGDKSLTWAVQQLLKTYEPDLVEKNLSEAIAEFLAAKQHLSIRQKEDYKNVLERLEETCGESHKTRIAVHEVTPSDIQKLLGKRKIKEAKSKNNVVNNLRAFFNWCAQKDKKYLTASAIPTEDIKLETPKKPRREILSASEAIKVMEFAEQFRGGVIVNYIATALFTGIRPDTEGELADQGLDPEFAKLFDINRGTIEITSQNSKTGEFRDVVIQKPLKAFYEAYPFESFPIVPRIPPTSNAKDRRSYLRYLLKKFREKCPVKIPHDGLRHSFCSYHVKLSKSIAETAQQAGDAERTIRKHYMRRVPDDEVEPFWSIRPKHRT